MAGKQAKITFVVDAKGAVKPMVEVEGQLKDISEVSEKTQKDLQNAMKGAGAAGKKAAAGAQQAASGAQQASAGMQQMAGNSRRAEQALFQVGQITEDAAFGLRGVANNITPAIQGFQRLKTESGGTQGAIKAMLGSLTGPAGIIFAFQALSTAALVLGPRIKEAFTEGSDAAEELREKAQEAFDTIVNFDSELAGVTLTPDNIEQVIKATEAQEERLQKLRRFLQVEGSVVDAMEGERDLQLAINQLLEEHGSMELITLDMVKEQIGLEEDRLEALRKQEEAFKDQEAAQRIMEHRGATLNEQGEDQADTEDEINLTMKQRLGLIQAWSEHLTRTASSARQVSDALHPPPLPDDPVEEQIDSFDQLILKLAEFQRIQEAGLIGGQQAAQREVQILTQGLMQLIREGIDPASQEFQALMDRLRQAQAETEGLEEKAAESANTLSSTLVPAIQGLGTFAAQSFNEADDAAGRFKKTLASIVKSLGSRALMTAIQGGTMLGAGGLGLGVLGLGASLGGSFLGMAHGGAVRGPGGPRDDRIPALLSNGEHIINARSAANARSVLDKINKSPSFAARMNQMAVGGPVGNIREMPAPNVNVQGANNDQLVSEIRSLRKDLREADRPAPVVRIQRFHEELEDYEQHVEYTNG